MADANPPACIIFDLGEVFIAGLQGLEKRVSKRLCIPEEGILESFRKDALFQLMKGRISEDAYLASVLERTGWNLNARSLKRIIRRNFHRMVQGSLSVLRRLANTYRVVLHSDHVREWIHYINSVHPFLRLFDERFYSFELGRMKEEPAAFETVLDALGVEPDECLFVDDRIRNVQTAESVGIRSIRFHNSRRLRHDLEAMRILD